MNLRFYIDPETGQPHIYKHGVTEDEVEEIFAGRRGLHAEDFATRDGKRIASGQTLAGRYLSVVYIPGSLAYLISARPMTDNEISALRRRQRRRNRR